MRGRSRGQTLDHDKVGKRRPNVVLPSQNPDAIVERSVVEIRRGDALPFNLRSVEGRGISCNCRGQFCCVLLSGNKLRVWCQNKQQNVFVAGRGLTAGGALAHTRNIQIARVERDAKNTLQKKWTGDACDTRLEIRRWALRRNIFADPAAIRNRPNEVKQERNKCRDKVGSMCINNDGFAEENVFVKQVNVGNIRDVIYQVVPSTSWFGCCNHGCISRNRSPRIQNRCCKIRA